MIGPPASSKFNLFHACTGVKAALFIVTDGCHKRKANQLQGPVQ
jgi:hypothetical protein